MACEKIRIGNHVGMICGRRTRKPLSAEEQKQIREEFEMVDAEHRMTEEQQKFLAKLRTVRARCQEWAADADRLSLTICARDLDHFGKELEGTIGNQVRAFRDDTLATEERLGIQEESKS